MNRTSTFDCENGPTTTIGHITKRAKSSYGIGASSTLNAGKTGASRSALRGIGVDTKEFLRYYLQQHQQLDWSAATQPK